MQHTNLTQATIDTPLGPMIAIANDTHLQLLSFVDQKNLAPKHLEQNRKSRIVQGTNDLLGRLGKELHEYFAGQLRTFKTPVALHGTPFQMSAWRILQDIPYGQTRSYRDQAQIFDKPNAYRAVANANAANQIAIIVPCHRIIRNNGLIGGYAGSPARKKRLINHERKNHTS